MAKIVRYGGNLKAFASEQQTNERTLFGQVTIANDLTSQVTAEFLRGWGIVGPSDQPSLQDFNAAMYTHGQLLAYLHQMGVAEYNATQEYFVGSVTQTGGVLYMSLSDANIGNTPSSSPVNWKAFTADQATEVALGLVKIATQTLTNAGADDTTAVTPKKLSAATQGQKHTAFTTTGTATAQVLTPAPAITAYSASQRFNVNFNIASGANPTINVSGQGVKLLKQYDSTGAKVAAVFAAGHNSDIVYDGTDWVLLDPLPALATQTRQGVRGSSLKWKASADGLSPSIAYSADMVTVCNAAGDAVTLLNLSGNLSTSATASATVNGMATGATAVSTIYGMYVWYNPTTAAVVVTGDLSLTTPTAPAAGFTHWARRGTFKTDSNVSNKYPFAFIAYGNKTQLDPATGRNLTDAVQVGNATGTIGSTAVTISGTVPSTAISVDFSFRVNAVGASVAVAVTPKSSSQNLAGGISVPSGATANCKQSLLIAEPGFVYWGVAITSSGTALLFICGWEDAL